MKAPAEILMIEDSATDTELTQRAFTRASIAHPLTVMTTGEAASDYLLGSGKWAKRGAARPPQLILLDLQLPKMSGIDFLRQIKRDPRTWDIPVISLSFTTSAPAIVTCYRLGVADHMIKPVDVKKLVRIMKKLKLPLTILQPEVGSSGAAPPGDRRT